MRDMQNRFSPQFRLKDSPARKVSSGVIIEEVVSAITE